MKHKNTKDNVIAKEHVAIEYFKMTVTEAVDPQSVVCVHYLRTNHGVIEATSEDAKSLLGKNRAEREAIIIEGEKKGLDTNLHSIVGINYTRSSFPSLDCKLVHKIEEKD